MGDETNGPAILFENVHKSFEENKVLHGLSLEVPRRKVTTILGPSGCGKSVTLKHVIGILEADEGRVVVDGQDMSNIRRSDLMGLRKRIGVLFQSAALFDSMTVFENVAFGLRMHRRMTEQAIHDRVDVCLKQVALLDADEKMPVDLSGGMRKRAALARSIALEPDFILYDEPTTGLDPRTANVVGDLILQLQRDLDITSVVVTHDIPLTMRISDKIALIDQGVVAASGSPEEVEQSSIFKKFFEGELGNQDEA
jgi:phospholipid/cholesterol/gamma-HCH transport system ATP-binding protein